MIRLGTTLGPYRILVQIGHGATATVWRAHQPSLDRDVAIKVLDSALAQDPWFCERFRAEATTTASLRNPNILQVLEFGEEGRLRYFVTELVDGGLLADALGRPLPPDHVLLMLCSVASALDYAHTREIVHGNVKPSKVLLTGDGAPVLAGFGLAPMLGSRSRPTQWRAEMGALEYVAPERVAGEAVGPPADRYALAVIAYEMLTGELPYHPSLPARERNPHLSPALEAALLKGLAHRPEDRYGTGADLVRALAFSAGPAAGELWLAFRAGLGAIRRSGG